MYGVNHIESFFRLSSAKWAEIKKEGANYFKAFPLADDPDFLKLKSEHQKFVMAYTLKDLAGFQLLDCYKFAYSRPPEYDNQNAGASACRLQNIPHIKKLLDKIDWMRVEAMGFGCQRIIEEETAIAYSDITEYLDNDGLFAGNIKELPGPIRRAIKQFEIVSKVTETGEEIIRYKLTLWDKGASLARMQKLKGMGQENINISGGTTNLEVQASADPKEAAAVYKQLLKGKTGPNP